MQMKSENGVIHWDQSLETPNEFEFTDAEKSMVVSELKALDESKSLTDDPIGIYKLFI